MKIVEVIAGARTVDARTLDTLTEVTRRMGHPAGPRVKDMRQAS